MKPLIKPTTETVNKIEGIKTDINLDSFHLENPFPGKIPVVYDIEVYPNYFLGIFVGPKGQPKIYTIENLQEMQSDICRQNVYLIGFNNLTYDDIVIKWILMNLGSRSPDDMLKGIFDTSDGTIKAGNNKEQWYWDIWNFFPGWFTSVDIFNFCCPNIPNTCRQRGLKERAVNRHWSKIQDLPIVPGKVLTQKEKDIMVPYCINDVEMTIEEWNDPETQIQVKTRIELNGLFPGVDVIGKHDAGTCEEIFTHEYVRRSGLKKRYLKSQIPKPGKKISIRDCLPSWINFESIETKRLYNSWYDISGRFSTKGDKEILSNMLTLDYLNIAVGAGGIHSEDRPLVIEPAPNELLMEIDVQSYYPGLTRELKLHPAHLSPVYNEIFEEINKQRVIAKKEGPKTKDKGLKIVGLSGFGKTGNKYSLMFDELMQLQITLGGQLSLLMLIERLLKTDIKVLSVNTDGIIVHLKKKFYPSLRLIYKQWQSETGQLMEETHYSKYVRRDVNNYIAFDSSADGGKIVKQKGIFKPHQRNCASIIHEALEMYFQYSIEPFSYINEQTDIRKFIWYNHVKKGWSLHYRDIISVKSSKTTIQLKDRMNKIQNTTRWYTSNKIIMGDNGSHPAAGVILKAGNMTEGEREQYKKTHETQDHPDGWIKYITVPNGKNAMMINDLSEEILTQIPVDLDRNYYIKEVNEIIKSIEG